MTTVLEGILDLLLGTSDVDEKARVTLLTETDPVCCLSIVYTVAKNLGQINNVSAFLSRACRNAPATPGQTELANAINYLGQSAFLDENALAQLKDSDAKASAAALGAVLTQGHGTLRNPSAYVCKSLQNVGRRGSEEGGHGPMRSVFSSPAAGAGLHHARHSSMGSSGTPRWAPPVGGAASSSASFASLMPGGLAAIDDLLARWRGVIDQKAWESLMTLDKSALGILQELDQKGDEIRSPSAYVQRAVRNRAGGAEIDGAPPARGGGSLAPPVFGMMAQGLGQGLGGLGGLGGGGLSAAEQPVKRGNGQYGLDEKAEAALLEASPEIYTQIIGELEQKGHEIRNPSAYVQRAISNSKQAQQGLLARREAEAQALQGFAEGGDSQWDDKIAMELQEELSLLTSPLDEKATLALAEVSPESAVNILRGLRTKGEQVGNPSAWVCKAVGNERRNGPRMEPATKRLRM